MSIWFPFQVAFFRNASNEIGPIEQVEERRRVPFVAVWKLVKIQTQSSAAPIDMDMS